jgi:hypothetical protein
MECPQTEGLVERTLPKEAHFFASYALRVDPFNASQLPTHKIKQRLLSAVPNLLLVERILGG